MEKKLLRTFLSRYYKNRKENECVRSASGDPNPIIEKFESNF